MKNMIKNVAALCVLLLGAVIAKAATLEEIGVNNRSPVQGKETDSIDGDFVLRNESIVAVIARPGPTRDANMTVRGVGACLIDLTRNDVPSDQLSCIYPAAGRYRFEDDQLVEHGKLPGGVFWRCKSTKALANESTSATVEYQLRDGEPFITIITTIEGDDISEVLAADGVRADRTFKFSTLRGTNIGFVEDETFRQTYGLQAIGGKGEPRWNKDRLKQLRYEDAGQLSDDHKSMTWTTRVTPASSSIDLWGLTQHAAPQTFIVQNMVGDQPRIKLSVLEGDLGPVKLPAPWRSAADGVSVVHLPPGKYRVRAEAIGHEPVEKEIDVRENTSKHLLNLGAATRVIAKVTDEAGGPIPCKCTFYGRKTAQEETKDPNFGLDSQSGSVGNCVYTADGEFVRSIPPGSYDVLISRGPEYDAEFLEIQVSEGGEAKIQATLRRVVDTTGWVSAELHSHSTPSGDNTSEQLGRVENLICEHIEFGPCTEHQRVESYDDQLEILGAVDQMATCTGMELTGSLLPINHQNAFPIKWYPNRQDGGGPRVSSDPVAQIAKLAMWDENSSKVVQTNHPNMRQLIHDKDLNGEDDGGFSEMLKFMDVIEVHPPEDIFKSDEQIAAMKSPGRSRMKPWMELFKNGYRIPGVINTDAHYNHHGSGWYRNWIQSSTDDPAKIQVEEMVKHLEQGRIVMSSGPFMTVQLHHDELDAPGNIGDTVTISGETVDLAIKIQCPNWLDVSRVEVFVNGEMQEELSRSRKKTPESFSDDVVKFDQRLTVRLPEPESFDTFIIVAAKNERTGLGRVMGKSNGQRSPVAVSNPIFVKLRDSITVSQ